MSSATPRLAVILVGDIERDHGPRVKYKPFVEALARRFPLAGVFDASLRGPARWANALSVFHPVRRVWRQRLSINVGAFHARSRRAAKLLRPLAGQADVVILQIGVLFNIPAAVAAPGVIYTDYTASLSARQPEAGRWPLDARQSSEWIALEKEAMRRALHVCARSRWVRDSIISEYGIPEEHVTAIGGGVNFDILPEAVQWASNCPPTALLIGTEFYRKGGDRLLRAFALARKRVPDARLLLLTQDSVPAELPQDGVELIAPTWDRNAIAALYRRADVFVLPSRLETWGDVLLEAMAYGLPCIGVAGQAMEEIIEHEVTGLIAPPEDVPALADALARLLGGSGLRESFGRAGRQKVEAEFTWDRVVERLAPLIAAAQREEGSTDTPWRVSRTSRGAWRQTL